MEACLFVGCDSNASLLENAHDVECLSVVAILKQNQPSRFNQFIHSCDLFETSANVAFYVLQSSLRLAKSSSVFEQSSCLFDVQLNACSSQVTLA